MDVSPGAENSRAAARESQGGPEVASPPSAPPTESIIIGRARPARAPAERAFIRLYFEETNIERNEGRKKRLRGVALWAWQTLKGKKRKRLGTLLVLKSIRRMQG